MEAIFGSRELYEYLEEQRQSNISRAKELSLYYKATSKSLDDDEYSLRIWLHYIQLLFGGASDTLEARETFRMIRMRFYKFYEYWRAYIKFEIESRCSSLGKVLQQGIDLVRVKEFGRKKEVLEYLGCVMSSYSSGEDLSKFCKYLAFEDRYEGAGQERNGCIPERDSRAQGGSGSENTPRHELTLNTGTIYSPQLKECAAHGEPMETPSSANHSERATENRSNRASRWPEAESTSFPRESDISVRLKFSPSSKEPWSPNKHGLSRPEMIPVQLERESYTQEITEEINALLNRKSTRMPPPAPGKRERMAVNGREIEILSQIGKGGSCKVYKVLMDGEIYALKKVELVGDEKILGLYKNEIGLLYKLKGSKEIVEIIDHQINGEYLYILLEYGEIDLASIIRRGSLSINFIKDVWEQMLLIVRRVHMERIIHCDLKPANFLFVQGRIKLIDFGISRVIRNDTTSILSEEQCGTVNYMSPEAVTQSKSKVTRSSDIWSLGCILYEMVHSRPPLHECTSIIQKIQRLQECCEFKYTSRHMAAVMVMRECLVKDPRKRPTIDRLLSHRFLRSEAEMSDLEALVGKAVKDAGRMSIGSAHIKELVARFYEGHPGS
jgi:serine/threonine-protein kinase TTK/MPS1